MFKKLTLFFILTIQIYTINNCFAQVVLNEDYSNPALWKTVHNPASASVGTIDVSGGTCNFNNIFDTDAFGVHADVRVYRALPTVLSDQSWTADFKFTPGSNNDIPADVLFALTADSLNPIYYTFTNPAPPIKTVQDGIFINYNSKTPSDQNSSDWFLTVSCKDGATTTASGIYSAALSVGTAYYFRLERLNATNGRLTVYSDASRTVVLGSPLCFSIAATTIGLTYLQHSTATPGGNTRVLNAKIDSTLITNNTGPTISSITAASGQTTRCSGSADTYSITPIPGAAYTWSSSSSTAFILSGQGTPMATIQLGLVSTTYTVTVDMCGVQLTSSIFITASSTVTANAGNPQTLNCNTPIVQIGGKPTASGGSGTYTYSWAPAAGLNNTTGANPMASPTITTTYSVTVSSIGTCVSGATSSVVITVNNTGSTVTANAGLDQNICIGNRTTIGTTAQNGLTYLWNHGNSLSDSTSAMPIAMPSITTTYIVRALAKGGCSDTSSVVITVSPPPLADAGPTPGIICVGSSVTIGTPTHAGYSYNWSPGAGLTTTTGAQPGAGPTINTVYTLIVTDNTSHCTASSQVQVSVDGVPAADAGKNDTLCYGRKATLGAPATCPSCSYSWNPSLYLDDATKSDPVFTAPAITGSFRYTLSVTSVTGCNKTATVAVVVQAPPTNYAGFDQVTCSGSPITIGFDNNPNLSYAWTPATALSNANVALPKASPVNTTTYISTATDKATGCFATDTVVVRVNRPPVHAGRDTVICPGNFVHLGVAPLPNLRYKWKPSSGLSDSTASNPTATPTMSMTYVLTADDTITTCPASDTVLVTIAPVPVANAGGAPKSTCRNQSVVLGGPVNANFNYSWSPATGLNSLTGSNPVANPTVTTTYTLLVQDKTTHCFAADQIVVRVLSTPTAHAGNDTAICVGDAAVLGAVPEAGVNYSWSPAAGLNNTGFANPIAHPTITTTYTVTATNPATLCTDVDAVVITVNPIPAANAGVSGPVCLNDPHVLGIPAALPSYRYQWLPTTGLNNPTAAQPVVTVTGVVSYSVTVTDNNTHCFSTSTVHLTIVAKPVAYAGRDTTICPANPVPIGFNAVAGVTYSWGPATALDDPSSPHPVASPTVTTTYTVSATVGLCVATDQVVINVRPVVVNAGAAVTICPGHPVQLGSPAMSGYAYSWSPATGLNSVTGAQPMATPTATTTYTLTATNTANGCSLSAAVVVTVDDIGQSGAIADGSICQGGAISLGRVSNNATASYTWVAFPAGTVPAPLNNPLVSPTTTTSYYVTVNNGNCTTKDMVVITVNPTPVPDVAGPVTICAGDSVHLGNNNTHDVYSWSPPDGLDHTDVTNPLASPSVNMTYIVTVSNGLCGQTKAVPVTVALSTVSVVPAYTLCLGSSVQLSATGGTGYQWGADPGLNNYSIANPLASPSVTTTYMVTITSGSSTPGRSCSVVKSVVVRVSSAKLAIRNTPDTSVCKGGAIGLHVFANSPNVVYRWGSSNTAEVFAVTDSVLVVTPSVTTTYYVSGHSVFCNGPDSAAGVPVVVSVKEIRASVTAPVLCYGVSGVLTVVNPNAEVFRYKWFPKGYIIGSDTSAVLTVNPPVSTNYVVELTNSLGCKLAIPATVVVGGDATTAAYASKSSVYEGEQVVLNAQPQGVNYGYKWGPGVFLPSDQVAEVTVSPTITTTYVVQVSDLSNAAACIGGASVVVEVKQGSANCNPEDIFIPNTFTPNGDGKNDVLYIRSHTIAPEVEWAIFNRWGEKVAEINSITQGWDGSFNGVPAEPGVYVYYLKYACKKDNQTFFKKGNVTVFK